MANIQLKQPLNIIIWFGALIGDYALLALSFFIAYSWGWISYPLVLLLLGIAQHRISILGHEGVHRYIASNPRTNDWIVQLFCYWPLLTDLHSYRDFHMDHHRHLGKKDLDPELFMKKEMYHLPITRKRLFINFFKDCIGASIKEFSNVVKYFGKQDNPLWALSFILVSGSLSFYFGHPEFFILYMISKPTTFWAVFRLRIYTEHTDIPGTHRVHLNAWQRFLFSPHNCGIHWEHHNFPHLPFWELPAIRKKVKDEPIITFTDLLNFNEANEQVKTAT